MSYEIQPERVVLAAVDAPKRARARSSCTSAHGKWLWLRMEVCATWKDAPKAALERVTEGSDAVEICRAFAAQYQELQEFFGVLCLDQKHRPIGFAVISVGGVDVTLVDMRLLFKPPLLANAAAIIVTHNHPSGDPTPSREDVALTEKAAQASKLLGLRLLDHIIIGRDTHFSFTDHGAMPKG